MSRRQSQPHAFQVNRVVLTAICAAVVLTAGVAGAQTVPTGYQDYFVLGHEQHMWDMMEKVRSGEGGGAFANGMNSVVTAVASADNQVLYFDHWEDTLEADILSPVQATTLVLGDGVAGNGEACNYTSDPRVAPCDGTDDDVLFEGSYLTLNSDQGLGAGCSSLPAEPERCTVPVNPRVAVDIRFDGGDRLVTSGGPLSMVHNQNPMSQYVGGATENISYQAVEAARSYSIPIGEDIYGGPGSPTRPFKYVDIGLVAFEDDTAVFIDSPGAGTASFSLDRGQHYSSLGAIDGGAGPAITINAGTKVSTNKALGGLIHTGGDGTYATRFYTLLPDLLHSTDYVITAPGDDPTLPPGPQANRPANIYIFNPDPYTAIDVTVTDLVGSTTINIPANSSIDYLTGTGRVVPPDSTIRMVSDRNFWGVSAYDYSTWTSDWGHSWLASKFLTGTYTVGWAPGSVDLSVNRSPVYAAATQNNTRVQVDFDNDGTYDAVDLDGNGAPDPAPLPDNTYLVNALSALSIFDHNDFDNTGTRIVANKPVGLAWGQETDLGVLSDPSLDTGYTVYPISQAFLNPVLTIEKEADVTSVRTAGGLVTYTLTVQSYDFGPITNLEAYDVLPTGVPGAAYVAGSTLVTYPDLSQDTTDPVASIDPKTGRDRLDWSLSPDTLGLNQTLTIRYRVAIPAGPTGVLTNTAHANGRLGSSVFSPLSSYTLIRTDASIVKTVTHDGTPEAGETVSYTLTVENAGATDETLVVITDPIPADTTFSAGSIIDDGPFTGSYQPAQNAVVWTADPFFAGTGPFNLQFDVVINPGVPAATEIRNEGSYESVETPYLTSNAVIITTGASLTFSKSGPSLLHPNEATSFDISVQNVGVGPATDVTIVDFTPTNTSYLAGSMEWSLNSGAFVPLTDPADSDEGTAFADRVEFVLASLGAGEDVVFRFGVTVDAGTAGQFVNNQATVSANEVTPKDTNLVQVPIVGDADVTGHVFVDSDGNGVQDPGESDLAFVDVVVTDSLSNVQIVTTDANGNYLVTVEPGSTNLDVDETDPDFPAGATLTTGNDPQDVTAVSGSTVASGDVGYEPPPLSFTKTSDAGGEVSPGQTVSYTLTLTNNTLVTQTAVSITDAVPTGTTYVGGSSQVQAPGPSKLRVTEHYFGSGGITFAGTSHDLVLGQALASNYFVVIQGSDGNGGDANGDRRGPDENYVALTADWFGSGDLGGSAAANEITLSRSNSVNNWVGVVTVVECLVDCTSDGFQLRDVQRVVHDGSDAGTDTSVAWSDVNQVLLMGGFNGAGCSTVEDRPRDSRTCFTRLWPSGSNIINWSRDVTLDATSTVMVVEWGSSWTVQRRLVSGSSGDNGANELDEYDGTAISSVVRANTWVWGTGWTSEDGVGDGAEGSLITLGDGVNQNPSETLVSVGQEFDDDREFDVWAMTHPEIAVDYRFKLDGDDGALTVTVGVDGAGDERLALSYSGMGSTNRDDYPAPLFSARYATAATVQVERRFSDYQFPAWVQGIDLSGIRSVIIAPGGVPPNLVVPADGYTIPAGESVIVTFQVVVDPDLDPAITQISNSASAATFQNPGPFNASVVDDVVRVGVVVEPNNAGYGLPGVAITYSHEVVNTGSDTDSYDITATTELGWQVELLDPATGAVLATDADGDGVWDGPAINTGTVASGASVFYDLRVTIPAGAAAGTQHSASLVATSDRDAAVSAMATDETLVVDSLGKVILTPDNSGVITSPGTVAYSHRVVNLTGAPETFDLTVENSQPAGWTSTIHWDTNGDGSYTPGVDLEIANTAQLADGESQLIFVVVTAAGSIPAGTVNVSHVAAISQSDPDDSDGATDTTTVIDEPTSFDLSGGGTRLVTPGTVEVFPGTLRNLGATADEYDFTISQAAFYGVDGLNHGSQLVIDSDADGVPDLMIGEDVDGDGTWDFVHPGYDTNSDGNPDVSLPGGGVLAYELRRPVDPMQLAYRDPVTLTATSRATGETDSVTATNLLLIPTHAVLAFFEAYSVNDRVIVEWLTALETGTLGFDIYRRDGDNKNFRKLNNRLLKAVLHAPQGGEYRFRDPTAVVGAGVDYMLVELDAWGQRLRFGPFSLTPEELPPDDPRRGELDTFGGYERQARRSTVRSSAGTPAGPAGPSSGQVKIAVGSEGLYRVDAGELAAAFVVSQTDVWRWIRSGDLLLTVAGDRVAWVPEEGGEGLYFFGQAIDSIYSDRSIYWIEPGAGPTMAPLAGSPPAPQPGGSFTETLHFEQEQWPLTAVITDPEGDFWMWEYVIATDPPNDSRTVTLRTPAPAATGGQVTMTVGLQGASDDDADPDHRVRISVNDTVVAEDRWNGHDANPLEVHFDHGLLNDGDNTLEINGLPVAGVDFDMFYLDAVDISYRRAYRAEDDRLLLASEGNQVMTVDGFTSPEIEVFDLSDRRRPAVVTATRIEETKNGYRVSFSGSPEPGDYLAIVPAAASVPEAVWRDVASDLRSPDNRADYLVIAGPGLEEAAEQLAEFRRGSGLRSRVARIEDVYDEFNHGIASPWAIRDLIEHAVDEWVIPPRYVLLAGDGSFDYLDRLGGGDNLVPAPMYSTSAGLVPSDHLLADLTGNDGVPEVAFGRLPVQSNDELEDYIAKAIAYEASWPGWKTRTLWVADDPDEGGEFGDDLESLIDSLAPRFSVDRILLEELGLTESRRRLFELIDRGASLAGYLGHGGLDRLAGEGLLMTPDVSTMDNGDRLPVLAALTCVVGRFDLPGYDTLAEALLLHPGGGAIAVWSPTSIAMNADAVELGDAFVDVVSYGADDRLGDAVRSALTKYAWQQTGDPALPFVYVLLGDPALDSDW